MDDCDFIFQTVSMATPEIYCVNFGSIQNTFLIISMYQYYIITARLECKLSGNYLK